MDQHPGAQEEAALLAVKQRLHKRFDSSLDMNTVDRAVETARGRFDTSPTRSFVPILLRA